MRIRGVGTIDKSIVTIRLLLGHSYTAGFGSGWYHDHCHRTLIYFPPPLPPPPPLLLCECACQRIPGGTQGERCSRFGGDCVSLLTP